MTRNDRMSKMFDTAKKTFAYEDKILDLIDHANKMERSDLQGAVAALVIDIKNQT